MILLLSSCTSLPDVPVCKEFTPNRAFCVQTISSGEFWIDDQHPYKGKTWWDMRPTNIQLPLQSWVEIKTFALKYCQQDKSRCSQVNANWEKTVKSIDTKVNPVGK